MTERPDVWGVLGGMGPIASAEFITTIYDTCRGATDQEMPIVYLHSDPTVPDRTASLLAQEEEEELLLKRLEEGVRLLLHSGVTRVVLCCMTLHCIIGRLPLSYRQRIISLPDVLFDSLLAIQRPHLMMCSLGARMKGLYETHALWEQAKNIIIMPDDSDQKAIHDLIYAIKLDRRRALCDDFIEHLGQKYGAHGFIAGCTELHLVARRRNIQATAQDSKPSWIDPLEKIANLIASRSRRLRGLQGPDNDLPEIRPAF